MRRFARVHGVAMLFLVVGALALTGAVATWLRHADNLDLATITVDTRGKDGYPEVTTTSRETAPVIPVPLCLGLVGVGFLSICVAVFADRIEEITLLGNGIRTKQTEVALLAAAMSSAGRPPNEIVRLAADPDGLPRAEREALLEHARAMHRRDARAQVTNEEIDELARSLSIIEPQQTSTSNH